jgi:hypothetical protein
MSAREIVRAPAARRHLVEFVVPILCSHLSFLSVLMLL